MRLRTIAIGLGVAALVAPATGLGAVAAVQDDQFPVIAPSQIETRLDLVKESGAKVARVDLFWSDVAPTKPVNPTDPTDPAYRWDRYDQVLGGLLFRNIRPIVSVYSSPQWSSGKAAPKDQAPVNPWFPKAADFANFMQAVATRYNGSFVVKSGQYDIPIPVRHWEIWNECNLNRYCRPQYDAKGKPSSTKLYAGLVKAAYPRIKRANPQAVVIAGVTGPKSTSDKTGIGTMAWLQALKTARGKFDAYSQHVYPAAAPTAKVPAIPAWSTLPTLFKEIDKIKRGMPMYITEAGYTTRTTKFRKVKVTEAQQNTYLKQIFALKVVKSKRIPVVVWFNLQDNPFWPGGLLRANSTKKPAWATFQGIASRSVVPTALLP